MSCSAEYAGTHCLHCGAYIDPMDSETIVRFLSDGTEVWCTTAHAAAWIIAGEELLGAGAGPAA